ncbi:MAG: hypothetical protein QXX12_01755 [Nanopusillaceae archaeon]
MEKLYVLVKKRTEARINGKLYVVEAGPQELDRDLAELLINVGLASVLERQHATKIEEKTKRSRR